MSISKTGFTLIELMIAVAIVAIVSTTLILVLNPQEILKQARDSQRIADLNQIGRAVVFYLTSTPNPILNVNSNCATTCYVHFGASMADGSVSCRQARHLGKVSKKINSYAVNGSGWLPVDLASGINGPALTVLPVDPINDINFYYSYACGNVPDFELDANLESIRYRNAGVEDMESTDGGSNSNVYEVGFVLSL